MPERADVLRPLVWNRRAGRLAAIPRVELSLLLALGLAAVGASGLAVASIFRHQHFGSNAYDLGLFDQTIWGYSRFELIPNTIVRLPNLLGDHFHPILVSLAPVYWLWDDPRALLVVQAILLALASVPIFLWARQELGSLAAVLFQVAFLAFWAIIGGSLFDFHELAFAAPIVSLALYAVLTERTRLVWATVVLALLTREDLALTVAALGVYVMLVQRRFRLGLAMVAVCLAWFGVMFKAVIPLFADRSYSHWWYSALGAGPASALVSLATDPLEGAKLFFTPREKQIALLNLFGPWLGLPLLSPLLIVALPGLGARFFSDNPSHWAPQGFHYSLALAPVLAFAAIDTARRLAQLRAGHGRIVAALVGGCVLLAGLYFSFGRLRPLDELHRYATDRQIAGIRSCLATIPQDASLAATSALVPHLAHRRRIYVIDRRPLPLTEYLAIDLATWHYPLSAKELGELADRALSGGFGVGCSSETIAVLQRGAQAGHLHPQLAARLALRAA